MGSETEGYSATPPSSQAPHGHSVSGAAVAAHANRLIDSTSPYLLQHAHNPVDWYPWGDEAHAKARREDKPIFLSIGYAACHWCHVMEHQVFEDPKIAELMNTHFVNIKVDREERPDLDDLYMLATQLMSGAGGWPMSVWLMPDLKPFYAGTYFPPNDGYGRPGFPRLELALADAWKNRRKDLEEQADRVVEAIRTHADESAAGERGEGTQVTEESLVDQSKRWIADAIEQSADRYDDVHGGLGSAPKFPPHQALQFWLALLTGPPQALTPAQTVLVRDMLTRTLDGMMNGGIYDHVGGGFARYSTDERWLVPHFEKMLYDSAQLAPIYALASALLGRADYARVARETLDFFMREMMSPRGAFYSSLDADSGGHEGLYYVWTLNDVHAAIPEAQNAQLIIEHFGITAEGNWHESPVEGGNVLAVVATAEALAEKHQLSPGEVRQRLDRLILQMRSYRAKRERPGLDDKTLTSWNGLMISALAICGRILREPKYLEAAHRAIGFLLTRHMEGGRRLLRVSRNDVAHTDAFLDDHAFLLNGLMDLIDSTTPTSLPGTMARKRALELADTLTREFEDLPAGGAPGAVAGGFFYTGPQHEKLFARMKNAADNATPSPNGVAIRALLRLARSSGKEQFRDAAFRAIAAFQANIARRPDYFPTILLALVEDAARQSLLTTVPEAAAAGGVDGSTRAEPLPLQSLSSPGRGAGSLLQLKVIELPSVKAGGSIDIAVQLTIPAGYHIQAQEPTDREAFRTVARLRGELALQSQEWRFPPTAAVAGDLATHQGYQGTVELHALCTVASNASPGRYLMRVTLLAQPCSGDACLPPERASAEFTLTVAA